MIGKNTAPINAVCCWGDSLTSTSSSPTNLSATAGAYPDQLRQSSAGRPVLSRSYPSQNAQYVTSKAVIDSVLRDWTSVYWAGTNNIATADTQPWLAVTAAAQSFQDNLSHPRLVVLAPLTLYNFQTGHIYNIQRQAVADALNTAFPTNFLDIWAELLAAGPAGNTTDGGSSVGTVHASLRLDALHLNDAGNAVVKNAVNAFLASKGW